MIDQIQRWVSEPPPDRLFEITELSLASVSPKMPGEHKHEFMSEKAILASPAAPNVVKPQLYRDALQRFSHGAEPKKHRTAAIVIPDYAVRMAMLDFEEFPVGEEERLALIRFRLRKTVPFHVEEAKVSYSVQFTEAKRIEVLAVAIAQPILTEYESLFIEAGYRVGMVTPSLLAALRLCSPAKQGLTVLAKSAGSQLSVLLIEKGRVRLVRCVDFGDTESGMVRPELHVLPTLQQTFAYAEDQIGKPVSQLLLCGFGSETDGLGRLAQSEFSIPYLPIRSKFGSATQANAGLLGLLEQYAA